MITVSGWKKMATKESKFGKKLLQNTEADLESWCVPISSNFFENWDWNHVSTNHVTALITEQFLDSWSNPLSLVKYRKRILQKAFSLLASLSGAMAVEVSGNLWQSVAISGRLWQSVTVYDSLWPSLAVCDSLWQPLAVFGNLCDSVWQCVAI